jgi:hypothetical protein
MKYILVLIISLISLTKVSAQRIDVRGIYSILVNGEVTYTPDDTLIYSEFGGNGFSINITPPPLNAENYKVYNENDGSFISESSPWNLYNNFYDLDFGYYRLKDGDITVAIFKSFYVNNPDTLYDLVLVDVNENEITNLDANYLNSIEFTGRIKDLKADTIFSHSDCGDLHWSLNNEYIGNEVNETLKNNDTLKLEIDGPDCIRVGNISKEFTISSIITYSDNSKLKNCSFTMNDNQILFKKAIKIHRYQIFDLTGKTIVSKQSFSTTEKIDISAINTGIYFLTTIDHSEKRKTVKFYKK